jgi:maleamate amidohydrolase
MKPALCIIDMQHDYMQHERLLEHQVSLTTHINELVDMAHEKNIPVIWIYQEHKADLSNAPRYNREHNIKVAIEGTEGAQILPELHVSKDDIRLPKTRYSAFFNTNFDDVLKELDIDTLIITGINTMSCVRVTAIDAYMRDMNVILATDCVDGYDIQQHETSLTYLGHAVAQLKTNAEILSEIT